jgi:hypothetical protein
MMVVVVVVVLLLLLVTAMAMTVTVMMSFWITQFARHLVSLRCIIIMRVEKKKNKADQRFIWEQVPRFHSSFIKGMLAFLCIYT